VQEFKKTVFTTCGWCLNHLDQNQDRIVDFEDAQPLKPWCSAGFLKLESSGTICFRPSRYVSTSVTKLRTISYECFTICFAICFTICLFISPDCMFGLKDRRFPCHLHPKTAQRARERFDQWQCGSGAEVRGFCGGGRGEGILCIDQVQVDDSSPEK
jgi:hypothetical protein